MDRLKDLKKGAQSVDHREPEGTSLNGGSGKNYQPVPVLGERVQQGQNFMQVFYADVELVKSNIAHIKDSTRKISEINQNVLQATTVDLEQDFSNELEPIVKTTNKKASVANQLLQRLRDETKQLKAAAQGAKQTPEIRIRENLANTLTRKFVDVMKDYQSAQTKYRTDLKKKVKRQVQIVKPDATTEEIDAVFKSGGGAGEVFKNAILTGEASDSIQNAFMNAKDKYQDVLTLEKSVAELHQMFLDFALLTEQQGELLDQIEHQVKEADDFIEQGNTELVQAIELQKSIRCKQCLIAVIILVVLGVIAGIAAASATGAF